MESQDSTAGKAVRLQEVTHLSVPQLITIPLTKLPANHWLLFFPTMHFWDCMQLYIFIH